MASTNINLIGRVVGICLTAPLFTTGAGYVRGSLTGEYPLLKALFNDKLYAQGSGKDGPWRALLPFLGICYLVLATAVAFSSLTFGPYEASIMQLVAAMTHGGMVYIRGLDVLCPIANYASVEARNMISGKQCIVALVHILVAVAISWN